MTTDTPAYETHEDGDAPDIRLRMTGLLELGGATPTLKQLKRCCRENAEHGCDPLTNGTVEVGLLLNEGDYIYLKEYAKSLTIVHGKQRRNS